MAQNQMLGTVGVVVIMGVWSMVHTATAEDKIFPQGPEAVGKGTSKHVTSLDDTVPRENDHPWASVIRAVKEQSDPKLRINNPANSCMVRHPKILYSLCKEEGVFPMFHDCENFIYCLTDNTGNQTKFLQLIGVCHKDYIFDKMTKNCIPGSCHPDKQNDPIFSPPGFVQDSKVPPSPSQEVSNWINEEPEWYSKQPALFRTPPLWYYTPPAWYNTPPTPHHTGKQKTQT